MSITGSDRGYFWIYFLNQIKYIDSTSKAKNFRNLLNNLEDWG